MTDSNESLANEVYEAAHELAQEVVKKAITLSATIPGHDQPTAVVIQDIACVILAKTTYATRKSYKKPFKDYCDHVLKHLTLLFDIVQENNKDKPNDAN